MEGRDFDGDLFDPFWISAALGLFVQWFGEMVKGDGSEKAIGTDLIWNSKDLALNRGRCKPGFDLDTLGCKIRGIMRSFYGFQLQTKRFDFAFHIGFFVIWLVIGISPFHYL